MMECLRIDHRQPEQDWPTMVSRIMYPKTAGGLTGVMLYRWPKRKAAGRYAVLRFVLRTITTTAQLCMQVEMNVVITYDFACKKNRHEGSSFRSPQH